MTYIPFLLIQYLLEHQFEGKSIKLMKIYKWLWVSKIEYIKSQSLWVESLHLHHILSTYLATWIPSEI